MTVESARRMTGMLILAVIALLVIYDVVIELKFGVPATISQVIFDTVSKNPWIAFLGGMLAGHWIWR